MLESTRHIILITTILEKIEKFENLTITFASPSRKSDEKEKGRKTSMVIAKLFALHGIAIKHMQNKAKTSSLENKKMILLNYLK